MAIEKALTVKQQAEIIAERMGESDDMVTSMVDIVRGVLAELHELVLDEVEAGIQVNVADVCKIVPRYIAAKPKRTYVDRVTGEPRTAAARPAKIQVRVRPSRTVKQVLPTLRSKAAKDMAADLQKQTKARAQRAAQREREARAEAKAAAAKPKRKSAARR